MTTLSRPVVYSQAAIDAGTITATDTNLTGSDWERQHRRLAGVDSGFTLTFSGDTATFAVGWGVWRGWVLEVTAPHPLTVPTVTTPTTYSLGVLFNPANYSTPGGPLSLAVYTKAGIAAALAALGGGAEFYTCHEIDRSSGLALASSPRRSMLARPTGLIYVDPATPPPAGQYPAWTLATDGTRFYRKSTDGNTWLPVTDDTGWRSDGFTFPSPQWPNEGCQWRVQGGHAEVYLAVGRSDGRQVTSDSHGNVSDFTLCTLPVPVRRTVPFYGDGTVYNAYGSSRFGFRVSNGVVVVESALPEQLLGNGANFRANLGFAL